MTKTLLQVALLFSTLSLSAFGGGKVVWLIGGEAKKQGDYHDLQSTVRQSLGRGTIKLRILDEQFIPVANLDLP